MAFFGLWSGLCQIFFFVGFKAGHYPHFLFWVKLSKLNLWQYRLLDRRRGKTVRTGGETVVRVQSIRGPWIMNCKNELLCNIFKHPLTWRYQTRCLHEGKRKKNNIFIELEIGKILYRDRQSVVFPYTEYGSTMNNAHCSYTTLLQGIMAYILF